MLRGCVRQCCRYLGSSLRRSQLQASTRTCLPRSQQEVQSPWFQLLLPQQACADLAALQCRTARHSLAQLHLAPPPPAATQALLACRVLDTPDEHRFDAITRLLASLFKARLAGLADARASVLAGRRSWQPSMPATRQRPTALHSLRTSLAVPPWCCIGSSCPHEGACMWELGWELLRRSS